MRKHRVAVSAALLMAAGSLSSPVTAHAVSGATTFYVGKTNCSDSTTNSAAQPYCTIQTAVNAATTPGDTVVIAAGLYQPFTVTASGTAAAPITIEGAGKQLTASEPTVEGYTTATGPAVSVNGASYVDLEGFSITQLGAYAAVQFSGASHDTLDSSTVTQPQTKTTSASVAILSGSSDITVSRNIISTYFTSAAIGVQGGSGDVVTTNAVRGSTTGTGISLDGTTGSDITSNTIVMSCDDEVDVTNGSTSTSIENNTLRSMDAGVGGCTVPTTASVAMLVDSSSTSGTTEDFNDVYPVVGTATYGFYSWAGTPYESASAFSTATGQGSHDSTDSDAQTIDSANSGAPGELATDIHGKPRVDDPEVANIGSGAYGYYDRGATESEDPLTVSLATNWPTQMPQAAAGTFTANVADAWSSNGIADCTYDFGDGTPTTTATPSNGQCSAQHPYSATGTYTIVLTLNAADGYTTSTSSTVTVDTPEPLYPLLTTSTVNAREGQFDNAGYDAWNITECDFDFGDGTAQTILGKTCDTTHTFTKVGTFNATLTVKDSGGNVGTATASYTSNGYYYTSLTPVRVLDTRKATGVPTVAKIAPGGTVTLQLAGKNGVPSGAAAVALTLTATNISGGGFVDAYPSGAPEPNASNLNFGAGQTVANTAIVKLGSGGAIVLKNNGTGPLDLIADLQGYFAVTGSGFVPIDTTRLLDTRVSKTTIAAGGTVKVNLGAYAGITAATLNLTATGATAGGHITAYPDAGTSPDTSNVNFGKGQTVADEAVVAVGADGYVDFENGGTGSVDLVVDLTGYFSTSGTESFVPTSPTRYLDTRKKFGAYYGGTTTSGAIATYGTTQLTISLNGQIGAVPQWAIAVAANVTVTQPTKAGYIEAYPIQDQSLPNTSSLNFTPGSTVANATTLVMTFPGSGGGGGGLDLYNGSPGTVQLIVDVAGYYS